MCMCFRLVRSSASRWKSFRAFSLASFSVCTHTHAHTHTHPHTHTRKHTPELHIPPKSPDIVLSFLYPSLLQCLSAFSLALAFLLAISCFPTHSISVYSIPFLSLSLP